MEKYFEILAKSEQEFELEAIAQYEADTQHEAETRSEYMQEQRMIDREYEDKRNNENQY